MKDRVTFAKKGRNDSKKRLSQTALGSVRLYEFDFDRRARPSYAAALTLSLDNRTRSIGVASLELLLMLVKPSDFPIGKN